MTIGSVIPFPGSAAMHQAQAAAAIAAVAARPVPQEQQTAKAGQCTDCAVDSRSRPLLDARSQLAAQEAAGKARQLERVAAQEQSGESRRIGELTEQEQKQVAELKKVDAEVRRHEQAHAAVGGQYAGAPTYEYTSGPDGKRYATSGRVAIDVSPVANDPKATVEKMEQVRRAATAPAEPSPEDRAVAAKASQEKAKAQAELAKQTAEELTNPSDAEIGSATSQASTAAGQISQSEPSQGSASRTERPRQTIEIGSLFGITA